MRKQINYGQINYKSDEIIIGPSLISKVYGSILLGILFGTIFFLAYSGVKGSNWLTIFKSSWYLVALMLWLGIRFLGGWSHKMVINKKNKMVLVTKRWLFYPYQISRYPFNKIKYATWEIATSARKMVLDSELVQINLLMEKDEWLSIGGVSYPQPGKSVDEGKEISRQIAEFIGVPSKEIKRKSK